MAEAGDPLSAPDAAVRERQTYAGQSLAARYASFVKLPHTLFALPFAGVGAVFGSAARTDGVSVRSVAWIVVAFTAARFAAMGFNRIVDLDYDAVNPRTRLRELPTGRLTRLQASTAVVAAAALFVLAAWRLNPLCGWLAPAALAWVFLYSYTKRFTAAAHLVLGVALSIAPVGAYLAITGAWSHPWFALLVLSGAVMCWVAGFDVIYSLQDEKFDRAHGLYSIPARVGGGRALLIARLLHLAAIVLFGLIWALRWFDVGPLYAVAVLVMAVVLHFGHRHARHAAHGPVDVLAIDRAFFRTNVVVSTTFFALTLLDRLAFS